MKLLVSKKLDRHSVIFPPLLALLLLFGALLVLDMYFIHTKLSLIPQELTAILLGDEENFIEPLPLEELLQILHTELMFLLSVMLFLFFLLYRITHNTKAATLQLIAFIICVHVAWGSLLFVASLPLNATYMFTLFTVGYHVQLLCITVFSIWRISR